MSNIITPTLSQSFAIGKTQGQKEAFEEVLKLIQKDMSKQYLLGYLETMINGLTCNGIDQLFKVQNDDR